MLPSGCSSCSIALIVSIQGRSAFHCASLLPQFLHQVLIPMKSSSCVLKSEIISAIKVRGKFLLTFVLHNIELIVLHFPSPPFLNELQIIWWWRLCFPLTFTFEPPVVLWIQQALKESAQCVGVSQCLYPEPFWCWNGKETPWPWDHQCDTQGNSRDVSDMTMLLFIGFEHWRIYLGFVYLLCLN
jgi:hypothetical protein